MLDFRGRDLTYDSHNGTDFAVPVGTKVLAAAGGEVVRIVSEFNRGGLKIFIDHGGGLMTTSAHLARPLVKVGQIVARGEAIALSGGFTRFAKPDEIYIVRRAGMPAGTSRRIPISYGAIVRGGREDKREG